jgi:hypothetical protein
MFGSTNPFCNTLNSDEGYMGMWIRRCFDKKRYTVCKTSIAQKIPEDQHLIVIEGSTHIQNTIKQNKVKRIISAVETNLKYHLAPHTISAPITSDNQITGPWSTQKAFKKYN